MWKIWSIFVLDIQIHFKQTCTCVNFIWAHIISVHISIILYCLSKDEGDIPVEPVIKEVNPYYTRAKTKQLFHKNIIILFSDDDETMDIYKNTGLDNDDQLELNDKRKHKEKSKVYSPEHTKYNYSAQHSSNSVWHLVLKCIYWKIHSNTTYFYIVVIKAK